MSKNDVINWQPLPHVPGCVFVTEHKGRKAGIKRHGGIGSKFEGSIDGVLIGEFDSPMTAFEKLDNMLKGLPAKEPTRHV